MLTVEVDTTAVEKRLLAGQMACPCSGVLRPWGFARPRWLRTPSGRARVRPRRARCARCGRSHVLLGVNVLVRRADAVEVIGAGLVARAAGAGSRRVAGLLGRARSTVRDWLDRFAGRAESLRRLFTQVLVDVDADPVPPAAAGSMFADVVAAIVSAADAVARRWGLSVFMVSPWRVAAAVTGGRLLSPDPLYLPINTSAPWPVPQ